MARASGTDLIQIEVPDLGIIHPGLFRLTAQPNKFHFAV
jgi:hypothetical protein